MIPSAILYLGGGLATLALLSAMILKIGALMADCPGGGPAARTAAITVATGFAAIGAGGVLLIGAALPLFAATPVPAAMVALGLAALCLGLGFTQAVATLREVLSPRDTRRDDTATGVAPAGTAKAQPAPDPLG